MMQKLTSQVENVFGNVGDVICHVLEIKREERWLRLKTLEYKSRLS